MNQASKTLLVMAGGTGGHVMPALAVADVLRARGHRVVWMGTEAGIEHQLVPTAGYELNLIQVKGVRGTGIKRKLALPFMLAVALWQSSQAILKSRADAVLGMGGFVSGPGALMAFILRKPLVIHEQNAVVGSSNRLVARLAKRRLSGFERVAGLDAEWVGNPIKPEIAAISAPEIGFQHDDKLLRILVIGGSQGALAFNQYLPGLLAQWSLETTHLDIHHQCGRDRQEATKAAYEQAGVEAKVSEFIDDMAEAYAWSDVVVCRSGAMTVAEIAAAGAVAVFVPFPYAVGDHQTANAQALSKAGAAMCIPQADFIKGQWLHQLQTLAVDRAALIKMAQLARLQAKPDAAQKAADICEELMNA